MTAIKLFWISAILITYVYLGYPAMLWLLCRFKRDRRLPIPGNDDPVVSLIIAAHNEEKVIAQKIENSLTLDYPKSKLQIIVVSDGSTDRTADIVRSYGGQGSVQLVNLCRNVGKASAQNEAVKRADGDILLFTDANVSLRRDSVRKLVRHFYDDSVGCVVGRVAYTNEDETNISEGESFYWRYELFLRTQESQMGNLVAGSGPIMAFRRRLFEPLDPVVSEDFVLPMRAAIKKYRTVYEPEAISSERLFQIAPRGMFQTRARTTVLDIRGLFLYRAILNPFHYPLYAWGLISHKLLRWLSPYFLLVLFTANLFLLDHPFYAVVFSFQTAFYVLAVIACLWRKQGKLPRIYGIPFSFCLSNAAVLTGVARFLLGKKSGSWKPIR